MGENEIKGKIQDIKQVILANSQDSEYVSNKIDELLSLKGQLDIEPTIVHIPLANVIQEYDNGHLRIIRCKDCIIWQNKGGFSFIVKPTMIALYEFFDGLLLMKAKYEGLTDEEKRYYDTAYFGLSLILQSPLFAVADSEFFADLVEFIANGISKVSDKLMNRPLQEETPIENAEFETKMEVANELLKEDAGSK